MHVESLGSNGLFILHTTTSKLAHSPQSLITFIAIFSVLLGSLAFCCSRPHHSSCPLMKFPSGWEKHFHSVWIEARHRGVKSKKISKCQHQPATQMFWLRKLSKSLNYSTKQNRKLNTIISSEGQIALRVVVVGRRESIEAVKIEQISLEDWIIIKGRY